MPSLNRLFVFALTGTPLRKYASPPPRVHLLRVTILAPTIRDNLIAINVHVNVQKFPTRVTQISRNEAYICTQTTSRECRHLKKYFFFLFSLEFSIS